MQHLSFYNETVSRKTEFNTQGMAEQEAGGWGIDAILEKLQQIWPIQISYYVKKLNFVVKASRNQGFFGLLLDEYNSS